MKIFWPEAKVKIGFFSLILVLLVSACKDENDPAPATTTTTTSNTKVNDWILENMKFWYLWNDELPSSPDKTLAPDEFFKSLLAKEDRFSWIQDNYQELLNSLQGISKEAGYEFVLYRESENSDNVIAQILYVKPNSPASAAGLKRGDIISQINGTSMTTGNYKDLLDAMKENHSIKVKSLVTGEDRFDNERTVNLTAVEYSEDPNYLDTILSVNNKKIGYYVYNFFATGTDGSSRYDDEMQNIFANFKAQGITDLVLDLRFNSGGAETAAQSLASFIGKGINSSSVFAKRTYNTEVQDEILADPSMGSSYLITKFQDKAANIGQLLEGGRVYVLTSSRTASASELVINALKPFMDVFIIGDVTYGKNVGSISLYDEHNTDNKWGMQPIVVRVSNSKDQSDYASGFTPNVLDEDNSVYLYPLGDTREALLSQAIGQITGGAVNARKRTASETKEVVGHSLDSRKRSFNLVIDQHVPDLKIH